MFSGGCIPAERWGYWKKGKLFYTEEEGNGNSLSPPLLV